MYTLPRMAVLALLAYGSAWADTVTSQVIVNDPTFAFPFPEFRADAFLQAPGFDPSLGHLDSLTVNWEVNIVAVEHYQTAIFDDSQVPLTFSQIATAGLDDSSATETLFGSTLVTATICHPCGVSLGFDLTGTLVIIDPDILAGAAKTNFIPLFGFATVSAGPDTGDRNTAFLTDGFLVAGSEVNFNAEATYSYTPVPEPRQTFILTLLCAIGFLGRRWFYATAGLRGTKNVQATKGSAAKAASVR